MDEKIGKVSRNRVNSKLLIASSPVVSTTLIQVLCVSAGDKRGQYGIPALTTLMPSNYEA